jgi:hypothetical protein
MKRKLIFISLACIFFSFSCFADDGFTYPASNKFEIGKAISPIVPSNASSFGSYKIKPTLPSGLQLDSTTGSISGIPKEILLNTIYTITAKNKAGVTSAPFNFLIEIYYPHGAGVSISEIWIFIICVVLIAFLIAIAFLSQRNATEALGLPVGSIRAIIAILFVVFFALLSVVFYFHSGKDAQFDPDLAKQIITILGTLVTAVSSFYFGSKTSEQAHANAAAAAAPKNGPTGPVGGAQGSKDGPNGPGEQSGQQVQVAVSLDASVPADVATAAGPALNNAMVQIVQSGTTGAIQGNHLVTDPNGIFTFTGVIPGSYSITGSLQVTPADATAPVTLTGTLTTPIQAGTTPITLTIK